MKMEVSIREDGSKRVIQRTSGPSLTRQEFKDECDVGKIIARFAKTPEGAYALQNVYGYLTDVSGRFNDVSGVPDYQTAFEYVSRADKVFEALPATVRTRFDNDAAKFMNFVDDPKNLDELRAMGLAKPRIESPVKAVDSAVSTPPVKG